MAQPSCGVFAKRTMSLLGPQLSLVQQLNVRATLARDRGTPRAMYLGRRLSRVFTPSFDSTVAEMPLGRSVSLDRAAELLNVSRRTIYNRIKDGRLQTIRTRCGSQRVLVESLHGLGFRPQPYSSTPTAIANDRPARS